MKSKTVKRHVKAIGSTDDGRPVLGGAFFMADTAGLPIEIQIQQAEDKGCSLGLYQFVVDACAAGWPFERAVQEVKESFMVLGRYDDADAFTKRITQSNIL